MCLSVSYQGSGRERCVKSWLPGDLHLVVRFMELSNMYSIGNVVAGEGSSPRR